MGGRCRVAPHPRSGAADAFSSHRRRGRYDLSDNGFGDHSPGGCPLGAAFVVEVVLTAFLVFTVLAATDRLADVAIPIGLVLVLIHLVGIPVDNTSVNPARSLGPAVFVGGWTLGRLWLFIVVPMLGALGASALHTHLFEGSAPIGAEQSAVAADVP